MMRAELSEKSRGRRCLLFYIIRRIIPRPEVSGRRRVAAAGRAATLGDRCRSSFSSPPPLTRTTVTLMSSLRLHSSNYRARPARGSFFPQYPFSCRRSPGISRIARGTAQLPFVSREKTLYYREPGRVSRVSRYKRRAGHYGRSDIVVARLVPQRCLFYEKREKFTNVFL